MEYADGTYLSQIKASSPKSACVKWAQKLDYWQIQGLSLKGKEPLIRQMKEASPVALDGMSNAWCNTALVRGKLVLINLVRTEQGKNNL